MSNKLFWDPSISDSSKKFGRVPTDAVVIDVITNEEHPEYDGAGLNIGLIKFKYLEFGASSDMGFTAFPFDISIREYPLIGEIVTIQKIRGRHYYSKRLNVNNDLKFNSYSGAIYKAIPPSDSSTKSENIQRAREGGLNDPTSDRVEEPLINENYIPRPFLHKLKHFDGDIVIQNRFGASLRFGSSQMENALNQETLGLADDVILGPTKTFDNNNPLIILSVGENVDSARTNTTPFALTVEDVNKDPSSFLLSSDQQINFKFATTENESHFRSSDNLDRPFVRPGVDSLTLFGGNQGILNSGRLIFNSKDTDIILSANRSINTLSNLDIISDAGRDNILSSTRDILIRPEEGVIVLGTLESGRGSQFSTDPLSLNQGPDTYLSVAIAEPLIEILDRMITMLAPTNAPGIGVAVTGQPIIPIYAPQMKALSRELNKIRSRLVRIEK